MFDLLTSIYAPHTCLGCDTEGTILCSACAAAISYPAARCYRCHSLATEARTCRACRPASKLFRVQVAAEYTQRNKDLVKQLKFAGNRSVAAILAERMSHLLTATADTLIVPVPTATGRVRLRGYDQSVLIARSLAAASDLPYCPALLRSGQQRQLGARRQDRLQQMQQSFVLHKEVSGRSIVLIDDVITTGATLEAAALCLRQAGARRVEALVYARA